MVSKRAKKRDGKLETNGIDRLSTLPGDVLNQILSFLPTESTIQTSLLSKRWEHVWTSVPALDAPDFKSRPMTFVNRFFDKYFLNRRRNDSSAVVTRFNLSVGYHGAKSRVDTWLDSSISRHCKDFSLHFISYSISKTKVHIYPFPASFFARLWWLDNLELEGIQWPQSYDTSSIGFPSAKSISLEKIYQLNDDMLSAMLRHCISLKRLFVKNCIDLKNPRIEVETLESFEMVPNHSGCDIESVRVKAERLKSLFYDRGYSNKTCDLFLVSCGLVKSLTLYNASFGDRLLEGIVSELPFLEKLVLKSCEKLFDVKIESSSLETLVVEKFDNCLGKKVTVVAPKLRLFSYSDQSLVKLAMIGSKFLEANVNVTSDHYYKSYSNEWYVNLIEFLSALDSSMEVSIHVAIEKALIIPEELRTQYSSPLPTLKRMNVMTKDALFRKRIFRASLAWILPSPETLTIEDKKQY